MLAAALLPTAAIARGQPKPIGTFQAWSAYTFGPPQQRTCYIVGRPIRSEPNVKRGDVYILISDQVGDKIMNQVSINAGYHYRKGSKVAVAIGSATFTLDTVDKPGYRDTAWALDAKTRAALIDAMEKGSLMMVKGEPSRGVGTTDTYSLNGVTKALQTIAHACR
jgi:hypothetical protein